MDRIKHKSGVGQQSCRFVSKRDWSQILQVWNETKVLKEHSKRVSDQIKHKSDMGQKWCTIAGKPIRQKSVAQSAYTRGAHLWSSFITTTTLQGNTVKGHPYPNNTLHFTTLSANQLWNHNKIKASSCKKLSKAPSSSSQPSSRESSLFATDVMFPILLES